MATTEAVCFDLDSTICVSNQSDEEIHRTVFERAGVEPFFTPGDLRAVEPGEIETAESRAEFFANLYRATANRVSADPDPALLAEPGEITADVVDPTDVSFREGAEEALAYAGKRYDLGLITNGGRETQMAKLEALGIADAFDATVFCDPAAGVDPKPAREPFERALSNLSTAAETTVYVGDTHAEDVVGAHEVGLRSVWVPPNRPHGTLPTDPEPEPTHRLDSIAELSEIL